VNRLGVYIGPGPRDSCPPSAPFILIAKTLDRLHVSKGKTVTIINSTCAVNLAHRRNYVTKVTADFYGMIQRIPKISLN
jgi:hypothetical protein